MSRRQAQIAPEAERAILATLLVVPDILADGEVAEKLAPEDFADPRCRAVYEAILVCDRDGKLYQDHVILADVMRKAGTLDRVGGIEFFEELMGASGEASSLAAHIEIVAEKGLLRRLAGTAQKLIDASTAADAEADAVLELAEKEVFALGEKSETGRFTYMSEGVALFDAYLEEMEGRDLIGVPSGWQTLDKLTSGWQAGQFVVVAGRPGMGKSAAALQMARHAGEATGEHVLFISYEMKRLELLTRLVSAAVGLSSNALRRGEFSEKEVRALAAERERLAQLPLGIHDQPPATITGLRSLLRRETRRRPVAMVVIDYLQLMAGTTNRENRTQEITEITRGLKLLAGELGVPILGFSQLNRGVEVRGTDNYRPRLSDLRDSGSIEQDADVVLFINRPAAIQQGLDPTYAEFILAKQRAGMAGAIIEFEFQPELTRFVDKGLLRGSVSANGGGSSKAPF